MKKRRIHPLCVIGGALMIWAFAMLLFTPAVLQYAFPPEDTPTAYAKSADALFEAMDGQSPVAVGGIRHHASLTGDTDVSCEDVIVYLAAPRFFEVFPLNVIKGELLSPLALREGLSSIVVDSGLAFALFGDVDPIGRGVQFSGRQYQVVGVADYKNTLGENAQGAAWVPLAADDDIGADIMTASIPGGADSALLARFTAAVHARYGESGEIFSLHKERLRAMILPGFVLLCLCLRLLRMAAKAVSSFAAHEIGLCRDRLKDCYFRQAALYVAGKIALTVLAAAGLVIAAGACLFFFIRPVYVFVEWVPEELVSFASIKSRFLSLMAAFSAPIRYQTPLLAMVRFQTLLLHWGMIAALTGMLLTKRRGTKPSSPAEGKPVR